VTGHPLRGRRHGGTAIEGEAAKLAAKLGAARRLRDRVQAEPPGRAMSANTCERLVEFVDRYGEHWATTLGQSPFDYTEITSTVPPGWRPLLNELHAALTEVDAAYVVEEFECRYGELCVDLSSARGRDATESLRAIIEEYERRSAGICEDCSAPAHTRDLGGWTRTLCDDCTPAAPDPPPAPNGSSTGQSGGPSQAGGRRWRAMRLRVTYPDPANPAAGVNYLLYVGPLVLGWFRQAGSDKGGARRSIEVTVYPPRHGRCQHHLIDTTTELTIRRVQLWTRITITPGIAYVLLASITWLR
jgi:hypothetical protein